MLAAVFTPVDSAWALIDARDFPALQHIL